MKLGIRVFLIGFKLEIIAGGHGNCEFESLENMSFQPKSDRRDRSRFPAQSSRQSWVQRGSGSGSSVVNQSQSPPNPNLGVNVEVNPSSGAQRGNYASRGRPMYRRERGKEKNESHGGLKEVKDPNLPRLVQEIQEKLEKSAVECMICYDMVRRSAPMWSCSSCYSIFHLSCIKKWAKAPTSVDLVTEKNQGFNWRCPGCQSVQLTPLKDIRYVCFCGKRTDPPSDLYLTPHSCGEPCGKPLEKEFTGAGWSKEEDLCPHHCVLQCHPGPCPPCKAFAPPFMCPCGKKEITTRCSDKKNGLTCGQVCDKVLECKRHRCERLCHVGPCDPCQVSINAPCFCKKKVEVITCGEMALKGEVNAEDGAFSCDSTCGKKLSCGNHDCADVCHPGPCGECELMPSMVKTCYCGKSSLQQQRQSCLDDIPTCSQNCGKFLPCQVHRCDQVCHEGACPPCLVLVTQKCRCGSTSRRVECYRTTMADERFVCDKPCDRKKNCRRHRCSERCCPSSNSNDLPFGDWDPHFCQISCEKKLRCGQHSCQSLCHSGHCPPCLETIFSDLTCACGRTSIPPPLPCGTPLPSCQLPCSVPQPCGHAPSHSCHFGDCPPCSEPVAKDCVGGHVVLRNIPCGSKDIRCNKLCGKTRQCGIHACGRTCHPPPCNTACGSEAGSRSSCGQTCGAPRKYCKHACTAPCHPSAPCPDVRCEFPVTITCSCGRISASVPCDVGGDGSTFNASTVQKLPVSLQPVESSSNKIPLGQRKLICDDECVKLERKKLLADAFDITPPNMDALHFGENHSASELFADQYRRDPRWVLSVEERCRYLVLGKNKGNTSSLKIHVFCPMLKEKRDAVRLIAERWKLAIYAAGREPKRFIVIQATPKSKTPARVIGVKGSAATGSPHIPIFDPLVDMDPRLVVSFLDLPREANISALVLRFGGECELLWFNDKNALAVFSDPARAATAMRRLEHGSAYQGAVVVAQNGGASVAPVATSAWGGVRPNSSNPWKNAVVQEVGWNEVSGGSSDMHASTWKGNDAPIAASVNRWSILGSETSANSSGASVVASDDLLKQPGSTSTSGISEVGSDTASVSQPGGGGGISRVDIVDSEVVDDWEKAYE